MVRRQSVDVKLVTAGIAEHSIHPVEVFRKGCWLVVIHASAAVVRTLKGPATILYSCPSPTSTANLGKKGERGESLEEASAHVCVQGARQQTCCVFMVALPAAFAQAALSVSPAAHEGKQ